MSYPSRGDHIARLREAIETSVSDLIDVSEKFALIDFPDHANVGDSAIYCGEMAFLDSKQARPSYVSTAADYSQTEMASRIGDGAIFLHGGGNFGSVWPWNHAFRETVIAANLGRRLIQLPQTVHFKDQFAIDQTARLIEQHGNFTLLVRDNNSYEQTRKNFQCDVRLCPDMAFALGPLKRKPSTKAMLINLRQDHEASSTYDASWIRNSTDVVTLDWPNEESYWKNRVAGSDFGALASAAVRGGRPAYREQRYRDLARRRLRRGIRMLSVGEKVITNRLHGHILCYLMDIPHCVIDNNYGKISGFMDAWGTVGANVYRASSVDDAIAKLT